MIGFLRKDLYSMWRFYRKNLALVFALYAVLVQFTRQTFLLYMMIWLMGFYSLSGISLDQASGWDRYARTLPADARQIVGAKFLSTLLMTGVGVAYSLAVGALSAALHGEALGELLAGVCIVTGVALAFMGMLLPAAYKWGVEKARNSFLLLFMAIFVIPTAFGDKLRAALPLSQAAAFFNRLTPALLIGAILLLCLLIFYIGYLISCAVYAKLEF